MNISNSRPQSQIHDNLVCHSKVHNKTTKKNQLVLKSYKTPRCSQHLYCLECIQNKSSRPLEECEECLKFFKNMKYQFFRRKGNCNLCGHNEELLVIGCPKHNYCQRCLSFITFNDFVQFQRIQKCKSCPLNIKNWIEMITQTSSETSSTTERNIEITEIIKGIFTLSDRKTAKSPEAPRFDCGNNRLTDKINNQPLESEKRASTSRILNNSSQKSEEVGKKASFVVSDHSVNLNPPAYQSFKQNSLSYTLFKEAACSLCRSELCVYGFHCNDNVCQDCLVKHCWGQISNFRRTTESIQRQFYYFCPVPGCEEKIDVPTSMVIKEMKKKGISSEIDSFLRFFDGIFM